jgi:hypothetical protein
MAADYKILSVMVCDDIRFETNGKEIIIGVYNNTIIVPSLPTVFPLLAFRVAAKLTKTKMGNVTFYLKDPSGKEITAHTIPGRTVETTDDPALFSLQIGPVVFPLAGVYSFWFGIDRKPEKTFTFRVRLPTDATESARLET